jgi:lipoprotein-releasing system permease protein
MHTALFIAKRYLFARKSHNVINIISIISVVGVMVGTMGLIIVLSVFNGFSSLVVSLYNSFDPDIKISAAIGKTIEPRLLDTASIGKIKGVRALSLTLEENALIKYRDRQFIATVKGVDEGFLKIAALQDKIIDGDLILKDGKTNYAVVGSSIAYSLGLTIDDQFNPLSIYVPKKGKTSAILNPEDAFNIELIKASSVFAIQQDFDAKYLLVPLEFSRQLIGQESKVTAIEIGLKDGADEEAVRNKISEIAGDNYKVETRLQQHQFLYKILKSEKWAVYFILSFILVIAIFNIIGSLTMLIIEKEKDITILNALGADKELIRKIFLLEGVMITMSGAVTGILLGAVICFLQQQFGFIRLDDGESFVVDAYPVEMQAMDFLYVILIVFVIGFTASWYTSAKLAKRY